ncbi:DUF1559 domain-containing protein [Aureliella helgolandensis]|uniref:DUF1559 domain-containing protein n=1 Tax=Aureliella helgolandensis TaxID=2527968 RepID=A0A518G6S4_9BACT|nr:DUF1559 domain-containing protein [Aureliella helgolandensis]QDV24284.1 hypothetical protein Q31a_25990 [Aureliella helgolandensis]
MSNTIDGHSKRTRRGVLSGLALLMLGSLLLPSHLTAQDGLGEVLTSHTPHETLAIVSVWPKEAASKEKLQLAPLEVITAAGLEQIGMDPLLIDRVDVLIGMPGPMGPQFGALVQNSAPVDLGQLNADLFDGEGLHEDKGFSYMAMRGPEEMVVHQLSPTTLIVGTKIFAKRMTDDHGEPGRLAAVAGNIQAGQELMAIVSVESLRPLLQGLLQGGGPMQLPPRVAQDVNGIVAATEFLAVRVMISDSEKLQVILTGEDAKNADAIEKSVQNLLAFSSQMIVEQMKGEISTETPTGLATHQYMDRISKVLVSKLTPVRAGNRLVLELSEFQNISIIGTLTGLLLPAVQSARMAARRMQSSNNLKQIALAMHNFHESYKSFPATAGLDDDGNPMISWRVAILPFIEEAALFERFKLDEPWDSEHNIALLEEMPSTYKHPDKPTKPGYTVYQATVGEESLLRLKEPTRFADITDGTSNTIMVIETTAEAAVPWTAPEDFNVDPENLELEKLFFRGITQAAFGDGSVRVLSESIDMGVLNALFTRAGGEVVGAF